MKCARSDAVGSSIVIVVASSVSRLRCVRDVEPPNRLDLVAEQLDPHRVIRIRREDIENAAAQRKLARQLDRRRRMPAALGQPPRKLLLIELPANANLARRRRHRIPPRHRLQQTLNAGDEDARMPDAGSGGTRMPSLPRSVAASLHSLRQRLQHPQPLAINLIMHHALARLRFPRRKLGDGRIAEERQIARNRIDFTRMRRNNHQRPRTRSRQRRRHQRARRPPDSAERPAMPRFEAGDHVGKAAVQIQMCGQLPQPLRRRRSAAARPRGSRRRGRFHVCGIVGRPRIRE